jgi:hypothetical protein
MPELKLLASIHLGFSDRQSFSNDFCVSVIQPMTPTVQMGVIGNQVIAQLQRLSFFIQPSAFDTVIGFSLEVDRHCSTGLGLQIIARVHSPLLESCCSCVQGTSYRINIQLDKTVGLVYHKRVCRSLDFKKFITVIRSVRNS